MTVGSGIRGASKTCYVFSDEAGDFNFDRKENSSKYFIICTTTMDSYDIGTELLNLRRNLLCEGISANGYFHATTDTQEVRNRVFDIIKSNEFQIDATILEKSKAKPQVRPPDKLSGSVNIRFYKYALHYHMKYFGPKLTQKYQRILFFVASIGDRKKSDIFKNEINDVAEQSINNVEWNIGFWKAESDPCIQIADYCCWAIQRKWELNDMRSYDLIKDKIHSEFDLWKYGNKHYY